MANNISIARKYRPARLKEIVGQEHIVEILSNSIRDNNVLSAYFLNGIRGVGKTTIARIIAMSLNCPHRVDNIEPCNQCESCISIRESYSQDVIELDAASRNGVDNIREITENANYMPISSKYKIFIIDEVHMLSNAAFNALLKTLEEPPAHTKFLLATTEKHKIPMTILSRCQKLLLKKVSNDKIANHIISVAKKEGYTISNKSAELIAKHSGGSVRDALSLLETVLLCHDNNVIQDEKLYEILDIPTDEYVMQTIYAIFRGDFVRIEQLVDEFERNSVGAHEILYSMLNMFHENMDLANFEDSKNALDIFRITKIWKFILKAIEEISLISNEYLALKILFQRAIWMLQAPSSIDNLLESASDSNYISPMMKNIFETSSNSQMESGIVDGNSLESNIEGNIESNIEEDIIQGEIAIEHECDMGIIDTSENKTKNENESKIVDTSEDPNEHANQDKSNDKSGNDKILDDKTEQKSISSIPIVNILSNEQDPDIKEFLNAIEESFPNSQVEKEDG